MEVTQIELFGVLISEPVTALTDIMAAAMCFYSFAKLTKLNRSGKVYQFFKYHFLSMGLALFIGGVAGHAFIHTLGEVWKLPGWLVSMMSITLVERASIQYASRLIKPAVARSLKIINLIELVTFIILTFTSMNFLFVEIHSAYGFALIVFPLQLFVYLKTRDKGSKIMLYAIGVIAASATVFIARISPHKWFNYMDFSHILIIASAYLFYLGVKNLEQPTINN